MTAPLSASRPHADRMDDATRRALRVALREELDAQEAQLMEARWEIDELADQTHVEHQLDREFAERAAQRAQAVIADVTEALQRLEAGTYGACHRCGHDIAIERLHAIPFTQHCVTCSSQGPRLIG